MLCGDQGQVAVPPVIGCESQPIEAPASLKLKVPVALLEVTVAVNVTACPYAMEVIGVPAEFFAVRADVVFAFVTVNVEGEEVEVMLVLSPE